MSMSSIPSVAAPAAACRRSVPRCRIQALGGEKLGLFAAAAGTCRSAAKRGAPGSGAALDQVAVVAERSSLAATAAGADRPGVFSQSLELLGILGYAGRFIKLPGGASGCAARAASAQRCLRRCASSSPEQTADRGQARRACALAITPVTIWPGVDERYGTAHSFFRARECGSAAT